MAGSRKTQREEKEEDIKGKEEQKQTELDELDIELLSLLPPEEYFTKILQAAEEGNTQAQRLASKMRHSASNHTWIIDYNGNEVTIFDDAVRHWLETFAAKNHSYAQSFLGLILTHTDVEKAKSLWAQAAAKQNPIAQFHLAVKTINGLPDTNGSLNIFSLSANGWMPKGGIQEKEWRDKVISSPSLQSAAQHEFSLAQYMLGVAMLQKEILMDMKSRESSIWICKAAENGLPTAIEFLKRHDSMHLGYYDRILGAATFARRTEPESKASILLNKIAMTNPQQFDDFIKKQKDPQYVHEILTKRLSPKAERIVRERWGIRRKAISETGPTKHIKPGSPTDFTLFTTSALVNLIYAYEAEVIPDIPAQTLLQESMMVFRKFLQKISSSQEAKDLLNMINEALKEDRYSRNKMESLIQYFETIMQSPSGSSSSHDGHAKVITAIIDAKQELHKTSPIAWNFLYGAKPPNSFDSLSSSSPKPGK